MFELLILNTVPSVLFPISSLVNRTTRTAGSTIDVGANYNETI